MNCIERLQFPHNFMLCSTTSSSFELFNDTFYRTADNLIFSTRMSGEWMWMEVEKVCLCLRWNLWIISNPNVEGNFEIFSSFDHCWTLNFSRFCLIVCKRVKNASCLKMASQSRSESSYIELSNAHVNQVIYDILSVGLARFESMKEFSKKVATNFNNERQPTSPHVSIWWTWTIGVARVLRCWVDIKNSTLVRWNIYHIFHEKLLKRSKCYDKY